MNPRDTLQTKLVQSSLAAVKVLARIFRGTPGDRHKLGLSKLPDQFTDIDRRYGRSASLDRWENEGGAKPAGAVSRRTGNAD